MAVVEKAKRLDGTDALKQLLKSLVSAKARVGD